MKNLTIILACVLLSGCVAARKTFVDLSKEEIENAKTAREVAINYLQVWPIQSGFIKGALGPRMDEIPVQALNAINELDELSKSIGDADPNDIDDYDLGLSLGLRVRILSSIVIEALRFYAPDILDVVPFLL